MSLKLVFTICTLIMTYGCNQRADKNVNQLSDPKPADNGLRLHKLKKLYVAGNFIGNGIQDTLIQHTRSGLTGTEIEYSPDPFQNEWDTVINWFYRQESDVFLTISKYGTDTLRLGMVHGLYCLINIGDNNADGLDEIALVVDYFDFSQLNSCKIYSLCRGRWILLKRFDINESSFDFTGNKAPKFEYIKDFLEKKNGKWVYREYLQDHSSTQNEDGKLKALNLPKCK